MLLVQGLLTAATRSAGKIFNTAFGWATILLFGKVPQSRQKILVALAAGSMLWLVAVLGTIVPGFATWLLAFVHLPSWVHQDWVRLAMVVGVFVIPPMVGALSLVLLEPAARPDSTASYARAVLRGYPYTLGLALTLVMLVALAPIMQARNLARQWTAAHVPVVVAPKNYLQIVDEIREALRTAGMDTRKRPASWMLRVPTRVLTTFARASFSNLVAENLTALESPRVEVLLHPADLVIQGRPAEVARARAIIAQHVAFLPVYMTWQKEANELEDRLRELWEQMRAQPPSRPQSTAVDKLKDIEATLGRAQLPYEEWEVVFRKKLLLERGLLHVLAGMTGRPLDPSEAPPERITGFSAQAEPRGTVVPFVPAVAGAATLGLLAGHWLGHRDADQQQRKAA